MSYLIEALDIKVHKRAKFINQHPSLQNYIRSYAGQDTERDLARCFVLTDSDKEIKGYYTLNSLSIPIDDWEESLKLKYKLKYKTIPCTLIGRLAIDTSIQGKGFGEKLLIDSLGKCYQASKVIASFAVVVDVIDQNAKKFYLSYGFIEMMDSERLFLPMKTIQRLIEQ